MNAIAASIRHPRTLAIAYLLAGLALAGAAFASSPYSRPPFRSPANLIDATAGETAIEETLVRASVGDINGDGYLDIIAQFKVVESLTTTSKVAFMKFRRDAGNPTLFDWSSAPAGYDPGPSPGPLLAEAGDLNGDGRADLISVDPDSSEVRVQLNSPAGFLPSVIYPMETGTDLRDVRLVDMDADGRLDVLVLGHSTAGNDDLVLLLRNIGSGALQVMQPWALRGLYQIGGFTTGDLNNDGLPDLVLWYQGESWSLSMYVNNGAFYYTTPIPITSGGPVHDAVVAPAYSGDPTPYLLVAHGGSGISVHYSSTPGVLPSSSHGVSQLGGNIQQIAYGPLVGGNYCWIGSSNAPANNTDGPYGSLRTYDLSGNYSALSPGPNPGRAIVADFDRDGVMDLVVPLVGFMEHQVAVILGPVLNATSQGIQLPLNNGPDLPGAAAIGDWNRDGKPDLAMSVGNNLDTWAGNGNGTFGARVSDKGVATDRLYGADMNRDGRLDLVHSASNTRGFQLGNGDGTFQAFVANGSPTPATYVRHPVVDMNRDGKPDLICLTPDGIGVEMGDGTAVPSQVMSFNVSGFIGPTHDALAADFDRDGDPDLAVATGWGVELFASDGVGFLQLAGDIEGGRDYRAIAAGDLDRDGDLDLVALRWAGSFNRSSEGVDVFYLDAAFNLVREVNLGAAERLPTMVEISDVNRDGLPDIVCAFQNDYQTQYRQTTSAVFLQSSTGTFQRRMDFAQGWVASDKFVTFADADGDRQPDLVAANVDASGAACLQIVPSNAGSGPFGFGATAQTYDFGATPNGLACGDINRDGKLDLVMGSWDGWVRTMFGDGNGGFNTLAYYPTPGITDIALADLSGDGQLDVVAATEGGGVTVLLGQGNGSFTTYVTYNTAGPIRHVRIGDFNRDGRPDVVALGWPLVARVFLSGNNGTLAFGQQVTLPGSGYGDGLAVADLNRDGILDLICGHNEFIPYVAVAFGVGDGTFGAMGNAAALPAGSVISGMTAADVNNDGKADVLVALGDGNTNPVEVLYGNGSGGFSTVSSFPAYSNESDYLAVGYVDGDAWPDIVQSGLAGTAFLKGNGSGGFASPWGLYEGLSSPAGVIIADLNRDGMNDVAVNDAGQALTAIWLNTKSNVTGVAGEGAAAAPAARPRLAQNAPNPFNPRTTIRFTMPARGQGSLVVYDIQGRRVATVVEGLLDAGDHRVEWNGHDAAGRAVASGVYLYRFTAGGKSLSRRMVLMK